jgi:hypothetical protein
MYREHGQRIAKQGYTATDWERSGAAGAR